MSKKCCCKCHCDCDSNRRRKPKIFEAKLNGRKEVPPNDSDAEGKVLALLSGDEKRLDFIVQSGGYTSPVISAHFHLAPAGVNGPVVKNIPIDATGNGVGTWTSTVADPEALTPSLVDSLKRGNIYVNIHTSQIPTGEIRGQVVRLWD